MTFVSLDESKAKSHPCCEDPNPNRWPAHPSQRAAWRRLLAQQGPNYGEYAVNYKKKKNKPPQTQTYIKTAKSRRTHNIDVGRRPWVRMTPSFFLQKKWAATWSLTLCQGGLRHPPPAAGQPRFCSGAATSHERRLSDRETPSDQARPPASQTPPGPSDQLCPSPLSARLLPPHPSRAPRQGAGPKELPGPVSAPHLRQKTQEQPGPPRRHPGPAAPPPALFPSGAGSDPFRTG